MLKSKLAEVERLVPPAALPKHRKVPIWLSGEVSPGAVYHPSAGWLENNGRVVEMAKSIERQNIDHFIDWSTTQPMMILHELSHAWHHRVTACGYDNPEISEPYQAIVRSGSSEKVRHVSGREKRHYGLSNPMEYFGECSEAYFGCNDFQLFDRKELKASDPAGFRLVEKVWGVAPGDE